MTRRLYEDDDEEAASLMAWMDRRLERADVKTLPLYVLAFKSMWLSSFDTLDNIPQEYNDKVIALYKRLKEEQG